METKTGVWIDLNKAIIVKLNNSDASKKTLNSGIESKVREEGEKNDSGRFGKQFIAPEKTREHKLQHKVNDYLKKVITEITDSDELVIFGPANMKTELQKKIEQHSGAKTLSPEVVTADSMTENQTVAWVKKYYNAQ